ncbi:MAG TPA: hypothetical protein VJ622_16760 [Acidimicrobiia bacterium]|nr:hypothetical protein [Acidimicrobiia bacterium]
MAPEETRRADGGPALDDVAALAEELRLRIAPAAGWQNTSPATVEGRFLRRLVGALSAYEAAHGILTPTGGDADALGG